MKLLMHSKTLRNTTVSTMSKEARKKAFIEMRGSKLKIRTDSQHSEEHNDNNNECCDNPLGGSILLGNYEHLRELEITENGMEALDLSSLAQLESLICCRNKLKELVIHGGSLKTLTAKYNCLNAIVTLSNPHQLLNIDISHNSFLELPNWISGCRSLTILNAAYNRLWSVENLFAACKIEGLGFLNLSYNNLRILSNLPICMKSVTQLLLHSNELQKLPENIFTVMSKNLKVLNVSCNLLYSMGNSAQHIYAGNKLSSLEELYISNNNLNESLFNAIKGSRNLRVLHAAYNKIGELPEECIPNWSHLQTLVISGNSLQYLPENISMLKNLEVLRLHSNLLLTTPDLTELSKLKVLDLAHNHLDHVNLLNIMPKNLKYLDLSCNLQLQFNERQVEVCQKIKKLNLIDVSGKNRPSLPTSKLESLKESSILRHPWTVGFSESTGKCPTLLVRQLRMCHFAGNEGLFGMFESSTSSVLTSAMAKLVPQILQHERNVKETLSEYMKYTLLSAYQRLTSEYGCAELNMALCHIAKETVNLKDFEREKRTKRFILRIANVGNITTYLIRKTSTLRLTNSNWNSKLNTSHTDLTASTTMKILDPEIREVALSNDDEFLVICNTDLWEVMDIDRVVKELRREENIVLAAKRVQDMAQSFGADKNISVILVRFRYIGTDVDDLLKELKQTVCRKTIIPNKNDSEALVCNHRLVDGAIGCGTRQQTVKNYTKSNRSSPSGQSEHFLNRNVEVADGIAPDDALEIFNETDSVLSEEQFKCWEYMLEQNTQLLFDKELNTISKSIGRNQGSEVDDLGKSPGKNEFKENGLMKTISSRFISNSSPQLVCNDIKKPPTSSYMQKQHEKRHPRHQLQQKQQQVSFLSKRFGSSRSFQTLSAYNLFESKSQNSVNLGAYSKLGGGPNAAYFGSLQRLMPYNLEYDFDIMQDRSALQEDEDDFSEHENRMKQYWGIATTEL